MLSDRVHEFPHNIAWFLNIKSARENKARLQKFHNIHVGQRCFIIATGPSLKNMDLSLLKDEYTIGMNRGYLLNEMYDLNLNYLCVIDIINQLKQFTDEYQQSEITSFYNWDCRHYIHQTEKINYLKLNHRHKFVKDILHGFWYGHSVTNACIELAYYMGFKEVYLIGKDHSFNVSSAPKTVNVIKGEDENHFFPNYYKENMQWGTPYYYGEEIAYKLARYAFERDNRVIRDATKDGKLQIFEKVKYDALF
jgi:hypothetical protein